MIKPKMRITKPAIGGQLMGRAIVSMVHLMYHESIALDFLRALLTELDNELIHRTFNKRKK